MYEPMEAALKRVEDAKLRLEFKRSLYYILMAHGLCENVRRIGGALVFEYKGSTMRVSVKGDPQ